MTKKYVIRCVGADRTTLTHQPLEMQAAEREALSLERKGRGHVKCDVIPALERAGRLRHSEEIQADRKRRNRCAAAREKAVRSVEAFYAKCGGTGKEIVPT